MTDGFNATLELHWDHRGQVASMKGGDGQRTAEELP